MFLLVCFHGLDCLQDKKKQCALSGTERTQYRAAKKLIQLFVNLLKCQALLSVLAKGTETAIYIILFEVVWTHSLLYRGTLVQPPPACQ